MPLLTSKNIWCPCLPHRLICNTFCCCFHLTNICQDKQQRAFSFIFIFRPRNFIWSLVLFLLLNRVSSKTSRMLCKTGSTVALFFALPPSLLFLSSSSCSSWSKPGCCNTSETSQIPGVLGQKNNAKNTQKHLQTKRALH